MITEKLFEQKLEKLRLELKQSTTQAFIKYSEQEFETQAKAILYSLLQEHTATLEAYTANLQQSAMKEIEEREQQVTVLLSQLNDVKEDIQSRIEHMEQVAQAMFGDKVRVTKEDAFARAKAIGTSKVNPDSFLRWAKEYPSPCAETYGIKPFKGSEGNPDPSKSDWWYHVVPGFGRVVEGEAE